MQARPNHPAQEQSAGSSEQANTERAGEKACGKIILRLNIDDGCGDNLGRKLRRGRLLRRLNLALPLGFSAALDKEFVRMLALLAFVLGTAQFTALLIAAFFRFTLLMKLDLALGQLLG